MFYMNDDNPQDWDGRGGSIMSAHTCCGTITYNKRALGRWWTDDDPCCQDNATDATERSSSTNRFICWGSSTPSISSSWSAWRCPAVRSISRGGPDLRSTTPHAVMWTTCGVSFLMDDEMFSHPVLFDSQQSC